MFCRQCGAQALGKFCGSCGAAVDRALPLQVPEPVLQPVRETFFPPSPSKPATPMPTWVHQGRFQAAAGAAAIIALLAVLIAFGWSQGSARPSGTTVSGSGSSGTTSGTDSGSGSEDAGSQYFNSGYALPSRVDQALTQQFQDGGSTVDYHKCKYFAPALGGAPVYDCTFKVDGIWHDNIQGTGHPDGTFSWQDDTTGVTPLS